MELVHLTRNGKGFGEWSDAFPLDSETAYEGENRASESKSYDLIGVTLGPPKEKGPACLSQRKW